MLRKGDSVGGEKSSASSILDSPLCQNLGNTLLADIDDPNAIGPHTIIDIDARAITMAICRTQSNKKRTVLRSGRLQKSGDKIYHVRNTHGVDGVKGLLIGAVGMDLECVAWVAVGYEPGDRLEVGLMKARADATANELCGA